LAILGSAILLRTGHECACHPRSKKFPNAALGDMFYFPLRARNDYFAMPLQISYSYQARFGDISVRDLFSGP